MKKQLLYFAMSLALVAFVTWSCDNGNADPIIIDGPPVIESITVTSGAVAGEDLVITVPVNDGAEGTTISTLARADWTLTGPSPANGSETLSGDLATITVSIAGGVDAGDYNFDITVVDSNGNQSVENLSFTVASGLFDISGDWRIDPVAGAFKVGPEEGSGAWWSISEADVATRACLFDDVYTFSAGESGTFSINMGDQTWLEKAFQGVDPDQCGAPVAPFVSGDYQFTYTATQLTLIGRGAAVGIAKVNNTGELGNEGIVVQDQIVYNIVSQTEEGPNRRMTLRIEAGSGTWWEFLLLSGPGDGDGGGTEGSIEGTWKLAPEAAALAVGGSAGDGSWWSNTAADVTDRACLFDDTWTFDSEGNMTIDLGDDTWLETWQAASEGCGAPTEPFVSDTFSFTYAGGELTVAGVGAYVGLQKVNNGKELTTPDDAVGEIIYNVSELTETTMTLQIQYVTPEDTEGWWQFKLVKE